MAKLTINGEQKSFDAPADMPLLWVLRDLLGMTGTKFGCGIAQCGACTVHVNGQAIRSCSVPISTVEGAQITTIEGLGTREKPDRVQAAFIAEQAAQCGYCTSGMIMAAAALLSTTPSPTATPSACEPETRVERGDRREPPRARASTGGGGEDRAAAGDLDQHRGA